jgi:hypothetical protein
MAWGFRKGFSKLMTLFWSVMSKLEEDRNEDADLWQG